MSNTRGRRFKESFLLRKHQRKENTSTFLILLSFILILIHFRLDKWDHHAVFLHHKLLNIGRPVARRFQADSLSILCSSSSQQQEAVHETFLDCTPEDWLAAPISQVPNLCVLEGLLTSMKQEQESDVQMMR
jgi:hypothetical protein